MVTGTPVANRGLMELHELIGYFASTLAIRVRDPQDRSSRGHLDEVKATLLQGFTHQAAPFVKVVQAVGAVRSASFNPLYQTMFALQQQWSAVADGELMRGLRAADAMEELLAMDTAHMDLSVHASEDADGGVGFLLSFSLALFGKRTINLLGRHLCGVLTDVSGMPEEPLKQTIHQSLRGQQLVERRAGYAAGGSLRELSRGVPGTFAEALARQAAGASGDVVRLEAGTEERESYAALRERATVAADWVVASAGLGKGDSALLQLQARAQHLGTFWGCVLAAVVPVTVAVATDLSPDDAVVQKAVGVHANLARVRAAAVLTTERLRALLAGLFPASARIAAVDGGAAGAGAAGGRSAGVRCGAADVAFYQLTSGSTGVPKAIQEVHGNVIHHVVGSAHACGYCGGPGMVTVNWLPFDHVVPMLTTHLRDVLLGCTQVQVPTSEVIARPLLWLETMRRYQAHFSWSPNFGFKLVADGCAAAAVHPKGRRDLLWALRRLMNAGEQVTLDVCGAFLQATGLDAEVMQPAFGMAEVCTCMAYNNAFSNLAGDRGCHRMDKQSIAQGRLLLAAADAPVGSTSDFIDLGPAIAGTELRICGGDVEGSPDPPLEESQIGRFQIRGRVVTPGYLAAPKANAEGFVGAG